MSNIFQSGNTIRLNCIFRDFDNEITDPSIIKIIFYDYKFNKIDEFILGEENKDINGYYFYDYIVPNKNDEKIYFEWYGEINGFPAIHRDSFLIKFI